MVGRGSRIVEGIKDSFILLDFGNNCSQHGFWEQPREWSLENDTTRFKRESNMTKECPDCARLVPIFTTECACGYTWHQARAEQIREQVEADLVELNGFQIQIYALGKTFEELIAIQQVKQYKEAWILHQLSSLDELKEYGKWRNFKPGWFHFAKRGFKPTTKESREAEIEAFKEQKRAERLSNFGHF